MKYLIVPFILLATFLSGCKSNSELYSEFKLDFTDRKTFNHCYSKHASPFKHKDSEKFYIDMLECRKTATKLEVNRSYEFKQAQTAERLEMSKLVKQAAIARENNEIAAEKLSIIEAKIKVHPEDNIYAKDKLIYCKTNPKWHEHGYQVARELELKSLRSFQLENYNKMNAKPTYLEFSNIFKCFNSVASADVTTFMEN